MSIGVVTYPDDGRTRGRADHQRRRSDVRLQAGRQGPRHGRPDAGARAGPRLRCSIRAVSDADPRPEPRRRGFSTRAIRAASRMPRARPDADERPDLPDRHVRLGRRRRARPGRRRPACRLRLQPDLEPDDHAPSASAYAELAGGEAGAGPRVRDGRHPRDARLARCGPGDRIVAPVAVYGSTRSQLLRVVRRLRRRVDIVDTTDLDAVARGPRRRPDARPLRRDDRQPDDVRGRPRGAGRAGPSPRRDVRRRQHVRLAVRLPAARARRRPRGRVGDEVPRRPQRRDRRRRRRLGRARSPASSASRSTPARPSGRSRRSSSCAGS